MLIAGAGGHAVELLGILEASGYSGDICFYDDVTPGPRELIFGKYPIISSIEDAAAIFSKEPAFCLGIGKPAARKALSAKLRAAGGTLSSVIASDSFIGRNEIVLGEGLNIMNGVVITQKTSVGEGTLIHVHCSIHHDTIIGDYCELSPGCRVLGGVRIGSGVSIGTNAVIMPRITIGDNAVIGAGAVVTKNVVSGNTVAGVPAQSLLRS